MRRFFLVSLAVWLGYTYGPGLLQRIGFPQEQEGAAFNLGTIAIAVAIGFIAFKA